MWAPQEETSLGRSWSSKLLLESSLRHHRSPLAQPGAAAAQMHDGLAVLCQIWTPCLEKLKLPSGIWCSIVYCETFEQTRGIPCYCHPTWL